MSEALTIAPGYARLLAAHGLGSLEAFFRWRGGERLDKRGLEAWRQRWRMVLRDRLGGEHVFYLKRFERPPLRRQLARWWGGALGASSAELEWENAARLGAAGVPAAQPVACGQEMRGPLERRSFILLAEAPGESLERWVPGHLPAPAEETDPAGRRRRLEQLAELVGRLHRAGLVHRDLYLSHVFICSEGRRDGFCVIDLQRVFRPRCRRRRWLAKDLAALDFSTPPGRLSVAERLRFLCRYARVCGRPGEVRRLARLVGRRTGRLRRRMGEPGGAAAMAPVAATGPSGDRINPESWR